MGDGRTGRNFLGCRKLRLELRLAVAEKQIGVASALDNPGMANIFAVIPPSVTVCRLRQASPASVVEFVSLWTVKD